MDVKVVFEFNGPKSGWQEIYYNDAVDDLRQAFNAAYLLANNRSLLLGDGCTLDAIRVTNTAVRRQSTLDSTGPGTRFTLDRRTYGSKADNVRLAALCSLYSIADSRQRSLYISGNPDSLYDLQTPSNADSIAWYSTFYNQFVPVLLGPGWSILYRPRPEDADQAVDVATWVPQPGARKTIVTVSDDLTMEEGDFVTFYGIRGAVPPPGRQRVTAFDSDTPNVFTIPYYTRPDFVYQGGGRAVVYEPAFAKIDFVTFKRIVGRKRGRPFGGSVGKSRSTR